MKREIRAIILAAGKGDRLRPYTDDCPKCFVELAGKPLICHQLEVLENQGVNDISIVTGYLAEKIKALGYKTVHNSNYAKTNMVESLMCAADLFDGQTDILITYGDIIFEPKVINALLENQSPICTTIDKSWQRLWQIRRGDPLLDAETLKLDDAGNILELGKKPKNLQEIEGQYMGLIKIDAAFAPRLVDIYRGLNPDALYDEKDFPNMYMTSFLQHIIDSGHPLHAVIVDGGWLEIDTCKDLELFSQMSRDGSLSDYCRIVSKKAEVM